MYIILSILLIIMLLAIFVLSYVANKKTPVPPGCEDIIADNAKCKACGNVLCRFSGDQKEEQQ